MMLVDVNTYMGNYPFRPVRNNTASELVELMNNHNIDKACVSSLNGIYYRDVMKGNYELLEAIAPYKDRFIPVCNINPTYAGAISDFCECIESHGFKGVKLFPKQHGYELKCPKSLELLNKAAEYGVFVQLPFYIEDLRQRHTLDVMFPLSAQEIKDAIMLAPNTNFILSNYSFVAFYNDFKNFNEIDRSRIYYDISRIECLGKNYIADMLKFSNIENLLFGTGAPLEYIDVQLVKVVFLKEKLGFTDEQVEMIMSKNICKLLKQ